MKRWLSLLLALCLCVVVMLALCASVSAKSECRLYDMTLKTESGEVLDQIKNGHFWVTVSAKKTGKLNATILLATYDSAGRYLGLYTMRASVPTGTVYELGALVDNTDGRIATMKAFAVDSLSGGRPLGDSIEYGKRSYTIETGEMGRPVLCWIDGTTEPATPIQSYDDGVSGSDLWSESGMSADQKLALYVNGRYEGMIRLGDMIAYGLPGRLTEVYSDRIVMIDTFLARVADIRKAEYAENGQLQYEAEISLNVWDDAVTHDANDSSAVRVCSLRNGSEDYPYEVGDYVLVWGHTTENNSVEDSGKLTAVTNIIGRPEEFTGSQTAAWSYGRHTIDGNTIADSHKYRLDEAGTDTGKYTWFLDPYGYLIGSIGKSADSESKDFILISGSAYYALLRDTNGVQYYAITLPILDSESNSATIKTTKPYIATVLSNINNSDKLFYIKYENGFAIELVEIGTHDSGYIVYNDENQAGTTVAGIFSYDMVNNLSAVKFEGASYYNNILCTVDGVYRYYIGVDTTINGNLISGQIENSVYILFNSSVVVSTVYVANPPVNS